MAAAADSMRQQKDSAVASLKQCEVARQAMEADMESACDTLREAKAEISSVQSQLDISNKAAQRLEDKVALLEAELLGARRERDEAKRELGKAEDVVSQLSGNLSSALNQARTIGVALEGETREKHNISDERNTIASELKNVQDQARAEMLELAASKESLSAQLTRVSAEFQQLQTQAAADAAQANAQLAAVAQELQGRDTELSKVSSALGSSQSSAMDAAKSASEQIAQLQASVERLENLLTRERSDHVAEYVRAEQEKQAVVARCDADKVALQDQLAAEAAQVQMLKTKASNAAAAERQAVEEWQSKHRLQGADLRSMEIEVDDLKKRLIAITVEKERLEGRAGNAEDDCTAADRELRRLRQEVDESQTLCKNTEQKYTLLLAQFETQHASLGTSNDLISQLTNDMNEVRAQMAQQARTHKQEVTLVRKEMAAEMHQCQEALEATKREMQAVETGKISANSQVASLQQQIVKFQSQIATLQAEDIANKVTVGDLKTQLATSRENLESTEQSLDQVNDTLTEVMQEKKQAESQIAGLDTKIEQLMELNESHMLELNSLREQRYKEQGELSDTLQRNAGLGQEKDQLGQALRAVNEEKESLTVQLDEAVDVVSGLHEKLQSERDSAQLLLNEHSQLKQLQGTTQQQLEQALEFSGKMRTQLQQAEAVRDEAMLAQQRVEMRLAGSELSIEEANHALQMAKQQVEHSRGECQVAEESYLQLKAEQEAHMKEMLGEAPAILSAYESGEHLKEADRLHAEVQNALKEANALHLAQAEIDANLPAKRESQRNALGAKQRVVLQSTDSLTSSSHFSTVSTMPPASHVHLSAQPHPSRSQRFLHQQAMQYPATGAFGKTLPIDPYLRQIGSSHVSSASRPI
jgi:chromosome segregation ATPase